MIMLVWKTFQCNEMVWFLFYLESLAMYHVFLYNFKSYGAKVDQEQYKLMKLQDLRLVLPDKQGMCLKFWM